MIDEEMVICKELFKKNMNKGNCPKSRAFSRTAYFHICMISIFPTIALAYFHTFHTLFSYVSACVWVCVSFCNFFLFYIQGDQPMILNVGTERYASCAELFARYPTYTCTNPEYKTRCCKTCQQAREPCQ